jgi:FtsZ-binding cell division protein ZapB
MNDMIAYQMANKPQGDLDEREKAIAEQQQEVMEALEARVQEAITTLESLHQELRNVTPKMEMLQESSALIKENEEKLSRVLAEAKAHFQNEKVHNQRLRTKLYRLEQLYQMKENRICTFTQDAGKRVVATIGERP